MSHIVDASVVLAVLLAEKGGAEAAALLDSAIISTVNLSEVYRRLIDQGITVEDAVGQVARFDLAPADFCTEQAAEAARLRPLTRQLNFSFADRACLALGRKLELPIYSADRVWADIDLGLDIRMIR